MLSDLPAELLLAITSYLDNHTDTLNLAHCCHAFYPLLLPKVFTALDLLKHENGHLSHLAHRLVSNKKLANEVHSLRVYNGFRSTSTVRYEQSIIQPLLEAIPGPDNSLPTWERVLQDRENNDAWVALLLNVLPNLDNLHVQIYPFSNYTLSMLARIGSMDRQPGSNLPLSNLRDINVEWWDSEGGIGTNHVLPIFRLPQLRTFTGKMICDGDGGDDDNEDEDDFDAAAYIPAQAGYSNVTHITLWASCSRKAFADLIHAPKRLESFVFEHSNEPHFSEDGDLFASRFHPPLYKHRESLQELVLTYDENKSTEHYGWEYVGSFVEFTALKKLRLRAASVLDWREEWADLSRVSTNTLTDVLPRSLETLIIEDMDSGHMGELGLGFSELVSDGNCHCPNLKYVETNGNWMSKDQTTEESNMKPRPIPGLLPEYASFKETVGSLLSRVGVEFFLRDLHVDHIMELNRANQ
ncbi:hypothetical protein BDV12DRAFT_180416 [Aspergillus spectabilis]